MRADRYLGIDVTRVPGGHPVPGDHPDAALAAEEIRGLINLRGQIVLAFDLRRRLGLPAPGRRRPPMNIVIRTPMGWSSLLVDRIGDVLDVDEELFEEPPETLRDRPGAHPRRLQVGRRPAARARHRRALDVAA